MNIKNSLNTMFDAKFLARAEKESQQMAKENSKEKDLDRRQEIMQAAEQLGYRAGQMVNQIQNQAASQVQQVNSGYQNALGGLLVSSALTISNTGFANLGGMTAATGCTSAAPFTTTNVMSSGTVAQPFQSSTAYIVDELLRDEVKLLQEVVRVMHEKLLKLERELVRMNSSGEGKDKSAEEILARMDCYVA